MALLWQSSSKYFISLLKIINIGHQPELRKNGQNGQKQMQEENLSYQAPLRS